MRKHDAVTTLQSAADGYNTAGCEEYSRRPHSSRIVLRTQLLRDAFVERHDGGFSTGIGDNPCAGDESRFTCHGHNVAVIALNHGGKEFLHESHLRQNVDLELELSMLHILGEYGFCIHYSGVIDEDGGFTNVRSDLLSAGSDCFF